MKTMHVTLLAVVCAGIGFGAGWLLKPAADTGGRPVEEAAGSGGPEDASRPGATLGTEAMRLASAQKELTEEQERHRETAQELAAVRKALAAAAPSDGDSDAVSTPDGPTGPQYDFKVLAPVLAAVDWRATGESIAKMGPLLVELADSLANGEGLPSSIADLQRWNAPLLRLALDAQKQGVPGTGIPGTFGHPSIVVNMVHAALQQAGVPLSENQAARLGDLGTRFVLEDERRLAGYDESTFQIRRSMEEAALKDRLYGAIDELVTEEQREILHPKAVRGRAGLDLFSSAVLWNGICAPIRFQTRSDLAASVAKLAAQRAAIPAELQPMVDELAADWARGFPDEYLAEEPDALQREGMSLGGSTGMPAARARVAAEHTAAFYRTLCERVPADSPAATTLHQTALVLVPVRQTAQED